jgi:hypothetical protein
MMIGGFVFATGATGLGARPGADQLSEGFSLVVAAGGYASSSVVGAVAQPASRIAAKKMMPVGLNTRTFCGTQSRTQDVSDATCLRRRIWT